MKKEDVLKFLMEYIYDITIFSEDECIKYSCVFPEIKEAWWTKTDGYFINDDIFNLTQNSDAYNKRVCYKKNLTSCPSDSNHIGVRPLIWFKSKFIKKPQVGNKIYLGINSYTIVDIVEHYVIALCDTLIARRRCNSRASDTPWNKSELKKWLLSDGLLRICASPRVVMDLSFVSNDSIFAKYDLNNDSQKNEWLCKQIFYIPDDIQSFIDDSVIKQFSHIPPSINPKPLREMEFDYLLKHKDYDKHAGEQRLFNFELSMVKESHWLNWKYRQYLEKVNFGHCGEWVEANRNVGTYCYVNILGQSVNFYPKDMYSLYYKSASENGLYMRPLIFVQTSQSCDLKLGDIGYLFNEKVIILEVMENGVYVVPTVSPNILHTIYKRQDGLEKYESDLNILGYIYKNSILS